MAARKPPYSAKCKYWISGGTVEIDGGMRACLVHMFNRLPQSQRMQALAEMQRNHDAISDKENAEQN